MSQPDGPRAAIVGAGLMGRWHADAVRRLGGWVSVIIDPRQDARESLGSQHPGARLLAELEPETVARNATSAHVCTPLMTHEPIVTALVNKGIHVLVEKPFAEDADATRRLLALASDRGVLACPVHQFLFQDGVQRMIEWLPSLGTLRRLDYSTCSAGAMSDTEAARDDLIAEILPHPLALSAAVLGAPMSNVAWQLSTPDAGEVLAVTTIGRTTATIAISSHGRPTENVVRVIGDAGSATADLFHGFAVRHDGLVSRRAKIVRPFVSAGASVGAASTNLLRRIVDREPAYPGLRRLLSRFYAAVRREGPEPFTPAQTLDVAVARDQILERLRAARTG